MDNICHTLVGAAMNGAGLARRTRLAGATLMMSSNLPDLDVLVFATDASSVAFRRGWTHGALAQALLPPVFAVLLVTVARWRARRPRAVTRDGPPLRLAWVIALSYAGVLSHVGLDYLNNYGIRLLAPFDWQWFYGDAVFIIDVWLWGVLGAGAWLTRRLAHPRPARGALVFTVLYAGLMLWAARASHDIVRETWRAERGTAPRAVMVSPLPVTPFQRELIVDGGDAYEGGTFAWRPPHLAIDRRVPKNEHLPPVTQALESPAIRGFLTWSRFPYWQVEPVAGGTRVTVRDMRFGGRFAASTTIAAD